MNSKLGIGGDIVMRLVEQLPKHRNFKIFFDNWSSSHHLVLELKPMDLLAVGTIRQNRLSGCSLKSEKELQKAGRGGYDYRTDVLNNVLILKWYDNKSVHVISSYMGVTPIEKAKRWSSKDKKHIEVDIPSAIKEYTQKWAVLILQIC